MFTALSFSVGTIQNPKGVWLLLSLKRLKKKSHKMILALTCTCQCYGYCHKKISFKNQRLNFLNLEICRMFLG